MALARFKWIARRAPAPGADAPGTSEGGFSLVETVIATSVMMAGGIKLAQLFGMARRTIVLQVLVTPMGLRTADDNTDSVRRKDQEARIISVKTRKAS